MYVVYTVRGCGVVCEVCEYWGVKPIVPIVAERWEWEGSEVSVYIHWSDKGWFDIEDGLNIHDALYVNSIILSIELF